MTVFSEGVLADNSSKKNPPHHFGDCGRRELPRKGPDYLPRLALSASSARSRNNSKNAGGWPMKSPIAVRKVTTPVAMPLVSVGRMNEHGGSLRVGDGQGLGVIRLV